MKAMLINRVGDIGLVLAILTIIVVVGGAEYDVVECVTVYSSPPPMVGVLLFIGAVAKSAQLGLHT